MEKKTLILVGAGKGLGNAIAREFASHDFRVVLMARNQEHLDAYKKEFEAEGIEVYTRAADASRPETLTAAIHETVQELGCPDAFVYNVGITEPDKGREITCELMLQRYQIDVASAYHCANLMTTDAFAEKKGAILFTGGASARTYATTDDFKVLRMDKSALNYMCTNLHHLLEPKGIFVGTVLIGGAIRPGDPHNDPAILAKLYWNMYADRKEFEVMSTSCEYRRSLPTETAKEA